MPNGYLPSGQIGDITVSTSNAGVHYYTGNGWASTVGNVYNNANSGYTRADLYPVAWYEPINYLLPSNVRTGTTFRVNINGRLSAGGGFVQGLVFQLCFYNGQTGAFTSIAPIVTTTTNGTEFSISAMLTILTAAVGGTATASGTAFLSGAYPQAYTPGAFNINTTIGSNQILVRAYSWVGTTITYWIDNATIDVSF